MRRSEGTALHIVNLSTRWTFAVASRPGRFASDEKVASNKWISILIVTSPLCFRDTVYSTLVEQKAERVTQPVWNRCKREKTLTFVGGFESRNFGPPDLSQAIMPAEVFGHLHAAYILWINLHVRMWGFHGSGGSRVCLLYPWKSRQYCTNFVAYPQEHVN
jgi:hypothetical protein